jgi:hypothetical protein
MRRTEPGDEERSVRRAAHFVLVLALLYNGYLVLASMAVGSAQCALLPLILILGLSRLVFRWLCSLGLGANWALLLTTIPALVWVGISNLCGDAIYWLKGSGSIAWMSWPALLAGSLAPYAVLVAVGLLKRRT